MKEIFYALIARTRKPIDGKLRNRLSVFLVCTVFSIIMWGMIKLSKEYQIPVKFNVVSENLPQGKVLTGNPDSVISITMKAKGLELYSGIFAARNNTIVLDLSNLRLKRDGDRYTGYLRTSKLLKTIAGQLPGGLELTAVEPDTLHYFFEKSIRRKVAVKPKISLDFSRQYQLYDSVQVKPDSVYISGKREIVDTISRLITEKKTFENLRSNATARLAIKIPEVWPALQLSEDSVTVQLNVEKFTEARVEVPVLMASTREKGSYRTFPEKVTLTCRVALRDYNRVDPSLITVVFNPHELSGSGSDRAQVVVSRSPSFLKVIRIEPQKVEYLILK